MSELQRYALLLQYNGSNYHGWQKQPGAPTIQEVLETCFSNVLKTKTQVFGCGRTDTGVHAREYVAHFDAIKMDSKARKDFLWKLNSYLPKDIKLLDIIKVKPDFNSRFDALSRTYKYYISYSKQPFNNEFSFFIPYRLDVEKMNTAAKILYQYDDFTSFSKVHTQVNNNICKIMQVKWEEKGDYLIFTIKANRFLRNMVRSIVGTLIDVGRDKLSIEDFISIIEAKDRKQAGRSVPANALFLKKIEYDKLFF